MGVKVHKSLPSKWSLNAGSAIYDESLHYWQHKSTAFIIVGEQTLQQSAVVSSPPPSVWQSLLQQYPQVSFVNVGAPFLSPKASSAM